MHSAVLAVVLLEGFVSMRANYDMAAVDRFRVSKVKTQVICSLGQLNQVVSDSDGSERLVGCIQLDRCSAQTLGP